MSNVNRCITILNDEYKNIADYCDKLHMTLPMEDYSIIEDMNPDSLNMYMDVIGNIQPNHQLYSHVKAYFTKVDAIILNLMNTTGSNSVSDLLRLVIGESYREIMAIDNDMNIFTQYLQDKKNSITLQDLLLSIHNSAALLDIIIKSFVPVEMYISNKNNNNNNKKTVVLVNKHDSIYSAKSEEITDFKYEVMLNNSYKITIKCAKTRKIFVIYGYFDYDVLNTYVATSHICNSYIYHKKKLLIEYVRQNIDINREYMDNCLSSLTIGNIISSKGNDMVNNILYHYSICTKISNIKFSISLTEFLKSSLKKKFDTIDALLYGSNKSVKYAVMLFGTTRDQNRDVYNNKSCVSDILFRNLNYIQQSKLKKYGHPIKQELERIEKLSINNMDLKDQCAMNDRMNDYLKKCVMNKIEEMKNNGNEYHKNLIYAKTLLEYPWIPPEYSDMFTTIGKNINLCRQKLDQIKKEFDSKVFGQTEFKTVIGDIVGKWFTNPNSMGKAIGLCGPPGCGKTLIASGLGKVLNIPYQEIHLGGIEDGSVLNGHSFTYSGAQPGLIVTKMVMAGQPRCILFFDELDKTCAKHGINEVFNILIHATDPNTNSKFSDKFFQDVHFPLNKCIFVFSFNDASKIDPILKDRMEIINVSPYSLADKIQISQKYLIPELLEGVGIEKGSIVLPEPTIEYLINKHTCEAGVRKLKNCIEKIFLKLNIDRIYSKGIFKNKNTFSPEKPIKVTTARIIGYLGKPNMALEKIHETNQIGVINGLYATTNGSGGIIPILCYPAKNSSINFTLELTGKQGEVMKESVNFSWTIAKNCVKSDIVNNFYNLNKGGIHIHTPDGSTPKDGPSAGCAFTIAFISRITGLPIKKEVAMTGEISIGGYVTAIGGLEHKLTGAKNAGVQLVFVCEQNIDDLIKIKETNQSLFNLLDPYKNKKVQKIIKDDTKKKITSELKIIIVQTIFDIVPFALIDPQYVEKKYNNSFGVYDKTCDYNVFMYKDDTGFINNQEPIKA
jgi:endopeptidase La